MKSNLLHVRLDDDLYQKIGDIALANNVNFSTVIREALETYTQNWKRFHDTTLLLLRPPSSIP